MVELVEATYALLGSAEPVSYAGDHLVVDGAALVEPRPVQDRIPLLVGGNGERAVEMVRSTAVAAGREPQLEARAPRRGHRRCVDQLGLRRYVVRPPAMRHVRTVLSDLPRSLGEPLNPHAVVRRAAEGTTTVLNDEHLRYCERIHEYRAAVEALPAGYHRLFDRAVRVLGADDRVRGLWLSGSLARGTVDAASDLDLLVAAADESHDEFASAWRTWLGEITATVLAEEQWFAKGSFWSITPNFERFDVLVEPASRVASTLFPVRTVVFDRDGLTATLPPERRPGPDPATVAKLVEDWFHFSAMLETVLWREDWLLAAEHLHFLGTAAAFAEELGVAWPTRLADAAEAHLRVVLQRHDVYPS